MVRGPMITEVTAGCASGKANARLGSEQSSLSARPASLSTASYFAAFAGSAGSNRPRLSSRRPESRSTLPPLRNLPLRKPQASGLQVSTPIPESWQTGRTNRSMPRVNDPGRLAVIGIASRGTVERTEHHGAEAVRADFNTGAAEGAIAQG